MFKKKCARCEKKIDKVYDFCPYCGHNLRSKYEEEDYGMIGKNDFIEEKAFPMDLNDTFMDKLLANAMKMLEKQMKNMSNEMMQRENGPKPSPKQGPNLNIEFFVNGEKVFPEKIVEEEKPMKIRNNITDEKIERLSRLPKKEPDSKVRRLSGKVVYELAVPGVKDEKDILINQLENSIEIKALGKDKVYAKTLNINLPILKYKLNNGNLILELKG